MTLKKIAALLSIVGVSAPAFATNGMNLEGYGAVSTAMGGTSMAFDNGAGAMMNNPATLGLMPQGSGLGVALGFLGPNVSATHPLYGKADSGGDAYYMPAIGYLMKTGKFTFGAGIYSQGGMGTEYSASSFMAAGTGEKVRSEVGVGRLIFPLAYNVNDALTIGGSLDWVWASMDIMMAANGSQFNAMGTGMSTGMMTTMGTLMGAGANTFRIDFSDNSDFTGEAFGSGFAAKLGLVYKINSALTIGAVYQSKTNLGDMKTDSKGASFSAYNSGASMGPAMKGKITIHDFQWPETYGAGVAYQATDRLMLAADYKRLNWSKVMKNFNMTYSTSALGGADYADFTISQNWKDQDVFMLGASYRLTDSVTLRAGANLADNPIPDNRVHPLFPAIVRDHYTFGLGYMINQQSGIDFSATYAPKVTVTGTQMTDGSAGTGVTANAMKISHSQFNWQVQYGYHF
jgi:long-chain fatty acid transport protein